MRTIGAWTHGILDYVVFILLIIGPSVFGFANRKAVLFSYLLAAVLFALAICTRFPLGVVKKVGFATHGAIELVIALLILILPWLANFSRGVLSRDFYVAMGILMLVIWTLTDFRGVRNRT